MIQQVSMDALVTLIAKGPFPHFGRFDGRGPIWKKWSTWRILCTLGVHVCLSATYIQSGLLQSTVQYVGAALENHSEMATGSECNTLGCRESHYSDKIMQQLPVHFCVQRHLGFFGDISRLFAKFTIN